MRRTVPLLLATAVASAAFASPASAAPNEGVAPADVCGAGFNPRSADVYSTESGSSVTVGNLYSATNVDGDVCFYLVVDQAPKVTGSYNLLFDTYTADANGQLVYKQIVGPSGDYDVNDKQAVSPPTIFGPDDDVTWARTLAYGTSEKVLDTTHTETRTETVEGTRDVVTTELQQPSAADVAAANAKYDKSVKVAKSVYAKNLRASVKKYKKAYGSKSYTKKAKYKKALAKHRSHLAIRIDRAETIRTAALQPKSVQVTTKVPTSEQVEVEVQVNDIEKSDVSGSNGFVPVNQMF